MDQRIDNLILLLYYSNKIMATNRLKLSIPVYQLYIDGITVSDITSMWLPRTPKSER